MILHDRIQNILSELHNTYPDSKCSLLFKDAFELLIGTILSAQTTDKQVNKVLPNLFTAFPTVYDLAQADPENVIPYIKSLGLYNNKAKSIVLMSRKIVSEYNCQIPNSMDRLLTLAGVGRKTANVVLGNALGVKDSGITVDTHVMRISKRLKISQSKNAYKIEKDLMKIIPVEEWVDITHLLIDHGRAICGRKPKCEICCIADYCPSKFDFPHFKKKHDSKLSEACMFLWY